MNDLNLRVSGGIGEKVKKPAAPVTMSDWNTEKPSSANEFIKEFLDSKSADEQLKLLKTYLNTNSVHLDEMFVEFLVSLFWGANAKHPVKGFLKKHITESRTLREPFIRCLSVIVKDQIKESANMPYGHYVRVVTHLDTCIDKFPPGAMVVSDMEIDIASYLLHCLESCVATLSKRDGRGETLAPTVINKIYDLAHLTLRLILYIIQKVTDGNRSELQRMFERLRAVTAELMVGEEVPMDTKSVSGIVALNMHLFENGSDSWIRLLDKEPTSRVSGTVDLCMYSAVATAVPRPALLAAASGPRPALLELADKVLDIGDSYSSDPSHALAVARTVLAISKTLVNAELALAKPLAARLAGYCWPQLDHHMDSVRHLAAQTMAYVVGACIDMEKAGDPSPLESLFSALDTLGAGRGAWAARAQLAGRLGLGLRARRPAWLPQAAAALRRQPQQASATIFLETLLDRYTQECGPETVYREYVQVVLEAARAETEPSALAVLEKVLAKAVQWDSRILEYILPDTSQLSTYQGSNLKCMLLVLGVARQSGAAIDPATFDQLSDTAFDSDDEVRLLALRLVALSPSSTARLLRPELRLVLRWLRHNLNAQAPGFRQLMLAHTKKILRRLEDSLNLREQSQRAVPASWLEDGAEFSSGLRRLCFESLVPGASYGRRGCALRLLAWQRTAAKLCHTPWTEERAELLYNALEDPYEGNKALALEVLEDCPTEFISKLEGPGERCLEQLLRQAGRVKPTECVSAAYKLLLLGRRGAAPLDPHTEGYPEREWFCVSRRLVRELRARAARAPLFGLLHCLHKAIGCVRPQAIAGHAAWSQLVSDIIALCWQANALAEPVVSAASPEGLLPDHGDVDSDGRPVTAQMVLMCAWRSVKETSLLLGSLVSRLCLEGESAAWTLSAAQVEEVGSSLAALLARARHRGAFEQAYVGYSALLARLWKCSSARLHQLPLRWFADIERDFLMPVPPEGATEYCATRRGAGLPFMIQALVTTELATESTVPVGRLLSRCVSLCLRARGGAAAARAHLVLRALVRHAQPEARHTAQAVISAVRGFDADTWMEQLRCDSLEWLRPSLFPTLLLLARLYPSALEGTVSNLKLERFLPLVSSLAGARDVSTRRLAARALPPLVAPHKYITHMQSLFEMLGDATIKMNLCHGILCQLSALLESSGCAGSGAWLRLALPASRRLAAAPSRLVADEYLGVLLLLLLRFPEPGLLDEELTATGELLSRALFAHTRPRAGSHVYLANAALMHLVILTTCKRDVTQTTLRCLTHTEYEVQLSAVNYLLTLHGQSEDSNAYLDHLSRVTDSDILPRIQSDPNYMDTLCAVAKSAYPECAQKALKLITISPKCPEKQHRVVQLKLGNLEPLTHERVVTELLDSALNAPDNVRHIYLESVVELVSQCYHCTEMLPVLRTLYEHCSAAADERSRSAVVGFLEMNYARLLARKGDGDELWCVGTTLALAAMLLEDDEPPLRARTAAALAAADAETTRRHESSSSSRRGVLASRAAQLLREWAAAQPALLLLLAALDFRAAALSEDQLDDESRVFDQNETHNVYLEEFTWTVDCANKIKQHFADGLTGFRTIDDYVASLVNENKDIIEQLCIEDAIPCLTAHKKSANPKMDLFWKILHQ